MLLQIFFHFHTWLINAIKSRLDIYVGRRHRDAGDYQRHKKPKWYKPPHKKVFENRPASFFMWPCINAFKINCVSQSHTQLIVFCLCHNKVQGLATLPSFQSVQGQLLCITELLIFAKNQDSNFNIHWLWVGKFNFEDLDWFFMGPKKNDTKNGLWLSL